MNKDPLSLTEVLYHNPFGVFSMEGVQHYYIVEQDQWLHK